MNHSKKSTTAAADLIDDLIIEILSRLPVKSVCRFKCVSRHWYHLIYHPEHRKKLPQTISGFFYTEDYPNNQNYPKMIPNFEGISGDQKHLFSDPSLPFLTGYRLITPSSSCNGLILCLCWKESPRDKANFVVCNPATEEWIVLPDSNYNTDKWAYRLGFDPAMSPHFHVFQCVHEEKDYGYITGVNIYSSKTGVWTHKENSWDGNEIRIVPTRGVFFNGMLHLLTNQSKIVAVDTVGKTWRTISLLETIGDINPWIGPLPFIGHSQGRLYYINMRDSKISKSSVWILEDSNDDEWVLKYSISTSQLFGELFGEKDVIFQWDFVGIHPECSLIFFVWRREYILFSYDMDRGKVYVICKLKDRSRGVPVNPYLPYVPFFSQMGRPRV